MKHAVCMLYRRRSDDKILAISREKKSGIKGDLGFPGGKVEPGESLTDALVREIYEECGVFPYFIDPVYSAEDGGGFTTHTFEAEVGMGEFRSSDEGELLWVDPQDLVSESCTFREYNKAVLLSRLCSFWPYNEAMFEAAGIRYK